MDYKILSWDIGIKNLAYCLISIKNSKYYVEEWDIINIVKDDNFCCECGKKAVLEVTNCDKKYCKKHSKKHVVQKETFDLYYKHCDEKCTHMIKERLCGKTARFNKNENNYCGVHAKQHFKNYEKSCELNKIPKVRNDLNSIVLKLLKILETKKQFLNVDVVLLENQPAMKNPTMKNVASTIYSYFMIRGVIDREKTHSSIKIVKYMLASNKLKLADEEDCLKLVKLKGQDSKTYKLTKALGIKYCVRMMENEDNKHWIEHLNKYKKKDDLADSFLQGMYYHFNQHEN